MPVTLTLSISSPPRICLLFNAYSTNSDVFSTPMNHLIKTIYDTTKPNVPMPGADVSQASQCLASSPTQPLSMALLDSLTVHVKMSLIHGIVTKVMALGKFYVAAAVVDVVVVVAVVVVAVVIVAVVVVVVAVAVSVAVVVVVVVAAVFVVVVVVVVV